MEILVAQSERQHRADLERIKDMEQLIELQKCAPIANRR